MDETFNVRATLNELLQSLIDFTMDFVPRLFTGLLLLIVGLVLAKIVQRVLRGLLLKVKFDELLERFGVDNLLKSIGLRGSASRGLARTVYYLMVTLFVQATAQVLGLLQVSEAISSFFRYLPNMLAALLIILIGNAVAQFARGAVEESARESGVDYAPAVGRAVAAVISFLAAIMAIAQLGIDTEMIHTVVVVSLSGTALAFALSFGLGTRDITRNIVAGFYVRKLFRVGEDIDVDGTKGRLEGISATKTLMDDQGELVTVANRELLEKTVRQ